MRRTAPSSRDLLLLSVLARKELADALNKGAELLIKFVTLSGIGFNWHRVSDGVPCPHPGPSKNSRDQF